MPLALAGRRRLRLVVIAVTALGAMAATACDLRGRRSLHSDLPTRITLVNESGLYRGLEWIDFQGRPQSYGGLNPGERKSFNTFMTHPWLVTTGPGDCLRIVMPRPEGSVVRLVSERRAPPPYRPRPGEEGYGGLTGCPPGTVPVPETDNCVPDRRRPRY